MELKQIQRHNIDKAVGKRSGSLAEKRGGNQ